MQSLLRAAATRPRSYQLQGLRTPSVNVAGVQRNALIQVKSFALNSALWCNNDNFPEGEVGPGNRREQTDACIWN